MLTLSKNSFTYTPDLKRINRHVTVATEQVIGAGTTHAITTLTFLPGDDIYHAAISVACSFPGAAIAGQPTISATCTAAAPIGVETLNAVTTTARVGFLRAAVDVSSTTPYTEVQVNLTAGGANFTVPAGSVIAVSVEPNEALLSSAAMPTPPALPVRFAGLAASPDCAAIHPDEPDEMWVFKNGNIQYFSIASETEIRPATTIASVFPEVTGTLQFAHRSGFKGQNGAGQDVFWQIFLYNSNMDYFRYEFVNGAFVFLATGNHSWLQYSASGYDWQLNFKTDNGVNKIDALGNTGNWQPYGPNESLYPTLPNTAPVTAVVNDKVNTRVLVFIGDIMYSLSGSPANAVLDSWTYG